MKLAESVNARFRCYALFRSGVVLIKSLFRNTPMYNKSERNRLRHIAGFEALECRKVFANTQFLFLEMDSNALSDKPIEFHSYRELLLAKPDQRSSYVEVRYFGFEIVSERPPRSQNSPTNTLRAEKPRFEESGLVGEGESGSLHLNAGSEANPSRQLQFAPSTIEVRLSLPVANTSQRLNESMDGLDLDQLSINSAFGRVQRETALFETGSRSGVLTSGQTDHNRTLIDAGNQSMRLDASVVEGHYRDPAEIRTNVLVRRNQSSFTEPIGSIASNVDHAFVADHDFFKRDKIGTTFRECRSAQEPAGINRLPTSLREDNELGGGTNTEIVPIHDWPDLPAGMVYLQLGTRTREHYKEGKSRQMILDSAHSELGLLQWFSTYDDQETTADDLEARPEIAVVEELTASHSESNSDLMFILLISGVLGSSRGFLIMQKERIAHNESLGKDGTGTKGSNRLRTGRN